MTAGSLPPEMVEEQGDVQTQGDPLSSTHEHQAEQPMNGIFWNHQLRELDWHRGRRERREERGRGERDNDYVCMPWTEREDINQSVTVLKIDTLKCSLTLPSPHPLLTLLSRLQILSILRIRSL